MWRVALGVTALLLWLFVAALNVSQSWNGRNAERRIAEVESNATVVYEQNKRLFADITELSAPNRLLRLIRTKPEWDLVLIEPQDVTLIRFAETAGGPAKPRARS